MYNRLFIFALLWGCSQKKLNFDNVETIKGMTISCQTWGKEWGEEAFEEEVVYLKSLGINWVTVHPYAHINNDGSLVYYFPNQYENLQWLSNPINIAHKHNMKIMIKPHISYWGSRFSWRGDIALNKMEKERFFLGYKKWFDDMLPIIKHSDAISVGTELDKLLNYNEDWLLVIKEIKKHFRGPLTYAANWTDYKNVQFWQELDWVGIQAYFPFKNKNQLLTEFRKYITDVKKISIQYNKPVIFTEIGYDAYDKNYQQPWVGQENQTEIGKDLQKELFSNYFTVLKENKNWLKGAFIWKWFNGNKTGPIPGEDYYLGEEIQEFLVLQFRDL